MAARSFISIPAYNVMRHTGSICAKEWISLVFILVRRSKVKQVACSISLIGSSSYQSEVSTCKKIIHKSDVLFSEGYAGMPGGYFRT